jgi:photosystem II stability/assembly factor-like uncharacterized protein
MTRLFAPFRLLTALASLLMSGLFASGQSPDNKIFERLEWRSIGPANMGGRITDIEGVPGNPNVVYVATGASGMWKTINGGITWKPIFERQGTYSLGDIALDPRNPDVIWAGSGEANPRNSVSFGDGVYKSTDGGKTWQHIGLKNTERISRVLVHPLNSDVAWVGALGHAFGTNEDRGVFMTTDGGKTWTKTLYIDAEHGVADMDVDSSNPNILYAAMWKFERKPWTFVSGSEKGGVYKSIDGGRTWSKLTNGLPKLQGRIGVKVAPSNPSIVYVITESKDGILYRSNDRGENFQLVTKQTNIVGRGFYYTDLRVDPTNENRLFALSTDLHTSIDGGKTWRTIAARTHSDHHAMWIDPQNPRRLWEGQDGGICVSYDTGETWEYVNNMPMGQLYHVYADNQLPHYNIMGGMQDNGSWVGPGRNREPLGILNDDWRMLSFGDGFKVISHPDNPDVFLSLSQGGNLMLSDMKTREQQLVKPWVGAGGGAAANQKYRFHWNSPLVFSPHNKTTVLFAGNAVFRSTDFGKTWTKISDDLTTNNPEKLKEAGGPIAIENTTAEYHCTIISLEESPVQAGMIWAGTDDGNVQLTTDGGKNWTNLIKNFSGVPVNSPVSHIEPSRTNASTAYVAFDRHMFDDFRPHVFKTMDGGKSWTNISGNLPATAYIHALKEDPKNPSLLYAGTELGLYATWDGGKNWMELGLKNLPRVAVHEIFVHPRENDLILATHGRSFWIFDDATPIQKFSSELASSDAHLFDVRAGMRFASRMTRYGVGDKVFAGPNPPNGAIITYYLKEKPDAKVPVKMQILDGTGKVIREYGQVAREKGLNRAVWDLGGEAPKLRRPLTPEQQEQFSFSGGMRGPTVLPGTYKVRLLVGDKSSEKNVEVRIDPTLQVTLAELQDQHNHAIKLRDMSSSTNLALRSLDGIKEQLQQLEKTVKDKMPDAPKELPATIANHLKKTDEMIRKLASDSPGGLGYRGSAQLAEKLTSLMFGILGPNAAPTQAQKDYFNELEAEYKTKIDEVSKFISEQMPKLNESLRKADAPTIIIGKQTEMQ